MTNGWVDTKTYLVGLLASSAINVVVIFSMKEFFLSGITLRSTIKKKHKMCEVTDNYYYLQPPNPWFSKDGSYYVTLIPSPQGNDGSFIHVAQVMVTVSTDELNPLIPKIWLLLLPSSYYTFPCKLVTRIWCSIKVISYTWWVWVFSLPVCWIMYGYCREKLHVNHFWELKG